MALVLDLSHSSILDPVNLKRILSILIILELLQLHAGVRFVAASHHELLFSSPIRKLVNLHVSIVTLRVELLNEVHSLSEDLPPKLDLLLSAIRFAVRCQVGLEFFLSGMLLHEERSG